VRRCRMGTALILAGFDTTFDVGGHRNRSESTLRYDAIRGVGERDSSGFHELQSHRLTSGRAERTL
jgi:hypothetical protein